MAYSAAANRSGGMLPHNVAGGVAGGEIRWRNGINKTAGSNNRGRREQQRGVIYSNNN